MYPTRDLLLELLPNYTLFRRKDKCRGIQLEGCSIQYPSILENKATCIVKEPRYLNAFIFLNTDHCELVRITLANIPFPNHLPTQVIVLSSHAQSPLPACSASSRLPASAGSASARS